MSELIMELPKLTWTSVKSFDSVSHNVLLEKWAAHGLDMCTVHQAKNWLDDQARQWWKTELNPAGGQPQVLFPRHQ